jgi:transposase
LLRVSSSSVPVCAQALQAARVQQETAQWKAEYAVQAEVEGTLSQGVRGFGLRRSWYIGLAQARLRQVATAAAINVDRTSDWFGGVPRAATRTSPFARLVA